MSRKSRKQKSVLPKFLLVVLAITIICLVYNLAFKTTKKPQNNTNREVSKQNEIIENTTNTANQEEVKQEEKKEDTTIKMTVMGDIMCHNSQYVDAYNSKTKKYNFDYVFKDVKSKLLDSDITIGNLETTFAGAKIRI